MKSIIAVLSILVASPAFAVDYTKCTENTKQDTCRAESKTCRAFYACQTRELNVLNTLVLKGLQTAADETSACREKRDGLEDSIWAHATTIECTDTPNGPQFGG